MKKLLRAQKGPGAAFLNPWQRSTPPAWSIPREWEGQTAVVIGGGPSLRQSDVDYAIEKGWRRVACNDAFLMDPEADVLCWADTRWYSWNFHKLSQHRGTYKITWRPMPTHNGLKVHLLNSRRAPPAISTDPRMIVGLNTGQGGINIAFLFGASRIILLGFDMHTVDGENNWHRFHRKPAAPSRYLEVFAPGIEAAGKIIREAGVEIINATPKSSLKCFPIRSIREIH